VTDYNVILHGPARDARDSLPVGNGDIGVNAWVEKDGILTILIGKTDTWGEFGSLLKVGRLRITTEPSIYVDGTDLKQEVDLSTGTITIESEKGGRKLRLRLRVDANHPMIALESDSSEPFTMRVDLDVLRTKEQDLPTERKHLYLDGMSADSAPKVYPDRIVEAVNEPALKNHIVWYHRNEHSVYPVTLKLQALQNFNGKDPLMHRTFGCAVGGEGFVAESPTRLKTKSAGKKFLLTIHPLTAQTEDAEDWLKLLAGEVGEGERSAADPGCFAKHCAWWKNFWSRSRVVVSGGDADETAKISLGWHANRYLTACTARGAYPVKFNGSIFNVPGFISNGKKADWVTPDYRNWGGAFWFQNQRHIYWPMLQAGDYDQMLPFFKMYRDALPLARERTRKYYGHNGVFFPETMVFWGTYLNLSYGWKRKGKPDGMVGCGYIRRYWQGGLELTAMMLDYYHHTQDAEFLKKTLLPIASEVMMFYDEHYKRDAAGKIRIYPAQMLESIWDTVNPMPEVAGLRYSLPQLLALPKDAVEKPTRERWRRMLGELPALPRGKSGDKDILLGAERLVQTKRHNNENARLYAVWPYKLYGVGLKDLQLARDTWRTRDIQKFKANCWYNDNVWAARLGLENEARIRLAERFTLSGEFKFPAMYIRGDWPPDHDNGGVCQNTVQLMLMQYYGKRILLLPAWPKEWNVDFKLHAPLRTTVEGRVENGKLVELKVTPKSRLEDVEMDESWKPGTGQK
jgi:hypothetical protein